MIKSLEIKTSTLSKLDFDNSTILWCFFFFFLFIDLFNSAVIALIPNPITKIVIPIRIPTKEAKEEIEKRQ